MSVCPDTLRTAEVLGKWGACVCVRSCQSAMPQPRTLMFHVPEEMAQLPELRGWLGMRRSPGAGGRLSARGGRLPGDVQVSCA